MIHNWIVASLAVVGALFLSLNLGSLIGYRFGLSTVATAGFFTGFAVIMAAHYAAPALKSEFAILVFVLGFGLALFTLRHQMTNTPLYATISGGIVALLLCLIYPPK